MEKPTLEIEGKKRVVDAILESGVDFTVRVDHPNLLHKLGILKKKRIFKIFPIKLGAVLKISRILVDLEQEAFLLEGEGDEAIIRNADLIQTGLRSIVKNHEKLLQVISIAIMNSDQDPPKSLIRFLNRNMTTGSALQLLNLVIRQMSIDDFLACMVSVKGMNLMGTRKSTSGGSLEASSAASGSPDTKSYGDTASPTS